MRRGRGSGRGWSELRKKKGETERVRERGMN